MVSRLTAEPPLVKGGQGRTDDDVLSDAEDAMVSLVCLVALFILWVIS